MAKERQAHKVALTAKAAATCINVADDDAGASYQGGGRDASTEDGGLSVADTAFSPAKRKLSFRGEGGIIETRTEDYKSFDSQVGHRETEFIDIVIRRPQHWHP